MRAASRERRPRVHDLIQNLIENAPYLGLFSVLLLCGLGLPLPEDVPLLLGGYLVHRELANLWMMFVVGMAGVLCGDMVLFMLGRTYGERILEHPLLRRVVTRDRLYWAESKFRNHGKVLIFAARFMPGARAVFFATAGIFRVRPLTFLLIDGTAALISVPAWIWIGYRFGKEAHVHLQGPAAKVVIFGTLALIVLLWFLWERRQKRLAAIRTAAASAPSSDLALRAAALPHASLPGQHHSDAIAPAGSDGHPAPHSLSTPESATAQPRK